MAKRTPPELEKVFYDKPIEIADFLRTARNLNANQLREITTEAKKC